MNTMHRPKENHFNSLKDSQNIASPLDCLGKENNKVRILTFSAKSNNIVINGNTLIFEMDFFR